MQNQLGNYLMILLTIRKEKGKLPAFIKSNEEEIFNPIHIANRFVSILRILGLT